MSEGMDLLMTRTIDKLTSQLEKEKIPCAADPANPPEIVTQILGHGNNEL